MNGTAREFYGPDSDSMIVVLAATEPNDTGFCIERAYERTPVDPKDRLYIQIGGWQSHSKHQEPRIVSGRYIARGIGEAMYGTMRVEYTDRS